MERARVLVWIGHLILTFSHIFISRKRERERERDGTHEGTQAAAVYKEGNLRLDELEHDAKYVHEQKREKRVEESEPQKQTHTVA